MIFFLFLEVNIVLLSTSFLELLLLCPVGFGSLCFHFHVSLGIFFLISSLISTDFIHWLFGLHVFVIFAGFFFLVVDF